MAIGIKLKHNTGEITTGNGDLQLGAAGNLKLKYATFPSADGTNTHVLSTDGAGNLSWVAQSGGSVTLSGLTDTNITTPAANSLLQYDGANWIDAVPTTAHITEGANLYYTDARVDTRFDTRLATKDTGDLSEGSNLYYTDARVDTRFDTRLATKDTDNLSEGSTNLYFTNARADARITNAGSANWNTAFGWGDHGAAGYYSLAANTINDTHIDWGTGANQVSTADIPEQTNLYYTDARADARITAADTGDLSEGSNLYYTDARARAAISESSTQLAYNNSTGVLTFTQGNTDTVAEGSNLYYTDARADARADVRIAASDTGDLSEGSNLYFTNARADARVAAASLGDLDDTTISGTSSGQLLQWNGSAWVNATVSAASAAGSDTHVQFNDGGNIGADAGLTYAKATDTLTAGTFATAGASPTVTAAGAMAITTTASNGNITMTPHGSGAVIISNTDINGGAIDGTAIGANSASTGAFTTINASGAITGNLTGAVTGNASTATALQNARTISGVSFDGTTNITLNTSAITENTNLYYTDARADARIGLANLSDLVDVHTAAPTDGQVLKWDNGNSRWAPATDAGGIALTDLSVTTGSASAGGTLAYNNSTGVFTFQPATAETFTSLVQDTTPQLGGTLDANGNVIDMGSNNITDAKVGQWDTAYTHSQAAHAPSGAEVNQNAFTTIAVSGQTDVVADAKTDTLTFVAGSNVTLTTTPGTDSVTIAASGGGGGGDTFKTIAVSGQSDVVADATTDTLTLVAGSNVTLTTDAAADSVTIAASGGGGGGTVDYEEFKCNYHTDGSLLAASNLSSGISGVNIDSAAGGDVTVTFTGYTTPPVSIMFYGYGYASNIYVMNTIGSTGTTLRQLPGGGSSGSPTAFGSFSTLKIKIREAETGASRSFGTATHAWIRFVMGA